MHNNRYKGYHGTDRSCYDNLEINKEFPVNKLPSDLGNGLYLFIDRKIRLEKQLKMLKII